MWDTIHIIPGTLNARGGRELVTLAFIRFFVEHRLGARIILYTKDEPDPLITHTFPFEFVNALRDVSFKPLGVFYAKRLWHGIPYIRLIQNTLSLMSIKSLTINLNADSIPIPAHICYVHFPYFSVGEDASLRAKLRKELHLWTLRLCRFIFVNSSFTRRVLCYTTPDICAKTTILHPPLPMEPMSDSDFLRGVEKRRNIVLTVSRFSREKKLETILDIAKEVNDGEFVIVGTLVDSEYYAYLRNYIEREHIHNVRLLPNASFEELHSLRMQSKIYLHPMPYEHFGISIIEAMASGCVPIVHKSGGPWYDILEHKEMWGYAYSSVDEATTKIEILLNDPNHYLEKASLALERSKAFTYEKFNERLHEFLYRYL
jgi:glycosyltransferase involved in cell wall biosynthesis